MPFKSAKQRHLFYAALNDPKLRKKLGLSLKVIREMLEHDKKRDRIKENPNAAL